MCPVGWQLLQMKTTHSVGDERLRRCNMAVGDKPVLVPENGAAWFNINIAA
jgi:hypothetical protein